MDPPGFAPTGRRWEVDGVDFQEYRDGRISKLRVPFDLQYGRSGAGADGYNPSLVGSRVDSTTQVPGAPCVIAAPPSQKLGTNCIEMN